MKATAKLFNGLEDSDTVTVTVGRLRELVAMAEARAEETLRDAEERANRIIQQTETESKSRRAEADTYALRSLRSLEKELNAITGSVRKGIELLASQALVGMNNGYSEEDPT